MADKTEPVEAEFVEEESAALVVAHPQALEALERAQQDVMIATAKRYPRPALATIRQRMKDYAHIDDETAATCFYSLRRKDKNGEEKLIQGPSIRLAEIALVCYQNIRAGSRVIANDGLRISSQGVCFDLENNCMVSVEESRSIVGKSGRPFSHDMQIMTGRAANAIARRNAIFEVIPRVLIHPVYEEAKEIAVGTAKTLEARRQSVLGRFAQMGVKRDRILNLLAMDSIESIGLEALEFLIGLGTAIKDGMTTIDEVFRQPEESEAGESARQLTLRDLARRAAEAKEAKAAAKKESEK